ncbi:unnamed protein product [Pleuronectes platessa]|uniref:Uncharacterized protein n=1 Tax=Pleuronectes platessa TaxID=8262 RepID=A0A9N7V970_PLEPL|nr:unnamed protein product [Pleuronectes platessa]
MEETDNKTVKIEALGNIDNDNVYHNNNAHAGDVGVQVYQGVEDQVYQDVEEDEPLPGLSREEDGQDSDQTDSDGFRWWDEFYDSCPDVDSTDCDDHSTDENTSPVKSGSAETEVVEEDPLPGPSRRRSREDETDENERCKKDLRLCHDFADGNCDNDTDRTVRDLAHSSTGAAYLAEKVCAVEETGWAVHQRVEEEVTHPGPRKKRSRKRLKKISRKTSRKSSRKKKNKRKKGIDKRSHKRFWWWDLLNNSIPDFDSIDCDDHNTDENTSPVKRASAETEVEETALTGMIIILTRTQAQSNLQVRKLMLSKITLFLAHPGEDQVRMKQTEMKDNYWDY